MRYLQRNRLLKEGIGNSLWEEVTLQLTQLVGNLDAYLCPLHLDLNASVLFGLVTLENRAPCNRTKGVCGLLRPDRCL